MESIISTFHIDWKIIIAQAINFGIVFVVLYIFALKPLAKMMAERSSKIGKGIDDAKENAELLEKTKAEYEKALAQARNEADKIFQEGKKEAEIKKAQMLADAGKDVENMITQGKQTLAAEKSKIVAEAKQEVAELAMEATKKLIGSKIDTSFDQKTVNDLNNI